MQKFVIRRWFMQDLIFAGATIAFFIVALGYVRFCDRVK